MAAVIGHWVKVWLDSAPSNRCRHMQTYHTACRTIYNSFNFRLYWSVKHETIISYRYVIFKPRRDLISPFFLTGVHYCIHIRCRKREIRPFNLSTSNNFWVKLLSGCVCVVFHQRSATSVEFLYESSGRNQQTYHVSWKQFVLFNFRTMTYPQVKEMLTRIVNKGSCSLSWS